MSYAPSPGPKLPCTAYRLYTACKRPGGGVYDSVLLVMPDGLTVKDGRLRSNFNTREFNSRELI